MTAQRKIFQIFRAGTHTSMGGALLTFSRQDLELIAAAYSKARRRAPLVLGHPLDDLPEYGEAESLFVRGDALYAVACPAANLINMVHEGRYKYVSPSFIVPGSNVNPARGAYYLRHIGFLGAHPPAVKGVAPPDFAEHGAHLSFAEGCEIKGKLLWEFPSPPVGLQFSEARLEVFNLAKDYQRACPEMDFIEAVRRAEFSIYRNL